MPLLQRKGSYGTCSNAIVKFKSKLHRTLNGYILRLIILITKTNKNQSMYFNYINFVSLHLSGLILVTHTYKC